jgi:hypothetical protein
MNQNFYWLTLAYTMVWWFAGHQTMHLLLVKSKAVSLNIHLAFLMRITSDFTLYLLIWIAFREPWYLVLLMIAIGFATRLTMIKIEKLMNLESNVTTVSIWGIVAIPILTVVCVGLTL